MTDLTTLNIKLAKSKHKSAILSVIGSYSNGYKYDKPIAKKYYDVYFSSATRPKDDTVYVAVLNKEIIGVIGYYIDRFESDNYWLGWFYIHKKWVRNKYGQKLLDDVIQRLRKKKVKKLFVYTTSDTFYRIALNLYLKNGFRIEAVIKNYYENGEDKIILSKKL